MVGHLRPGRRRMTLVVDTREHENRLMVRGRLVRILQDAHAGELAAALAYRSHARSLRHEAERAEVRRIEQAEWHHRAVVAVVLDELSASPRAPRELLMGAVGRFFGALCFGAAGSRRCTPPADSRR
jgi:demethoxyubiquinone hydroxylase (CLK1/Coq7/Cat5 family)